LAFLGPDLAYLFDELQISEQVQANISAREIRKLGVFAKVEPSEDSFREWLKVDLGLNPTSSIGERVVVAKLAEAWEAARQRASTTRKLDAEARVSGQAREMLKGTHLALRRACARAHGTVEDRRCPGRAYLENRLEQLDDGELEAEPLSKVTTVALEQESVASNTGAGVDVRKDGLLHVVKGKRTAPLPTGPEQFRAVMKVMALHWEMVHLKGAGRSVLKDYSVAVFEKHAEYILGDECLLIGEANPTMSCVPSWDLLMKYELEVRKLAIRKVNEGGATLAEAMAMARTSVEHRTSYFITPLPCRVRGHRCRGLLFSRLRTLVGASARLRKLGATTKAAAGAAERQRVQARAKPRARARTRSRGTRAPSTSSRSCRRGRRIS